MPRLTAPTQKGRSPRSWLERPERFGEDSRSSGPTSANPGEKGPRTGVQVALPCGRRTRSAHGQRRFPLRARKRKRAYRTAFHSTGLHSTCAQQHGHPPTHSLTHSLFTTRTLCAKGPVIEVRSALAVSLVSKEFRSSHHVSCHCMLQETSLASLRALRIGRTSRPGSSAALLCRVSAHVSATHVAFVPLNQAGKPT